MQGLFPWHYFDRELTHPLWQLHQACGGMSGLLQCTNLQCHFSSTLQSPCAGMRGWHSTGLRQHYAESDLWLHANIYIMNMFGAEETWLCDTLFNKTSIMCFDIKSMMYIHGFLCFRQSKGWYWYSRSNKNTFWLLSRLKGGWFIIELSPSEIEQCVTSVFGMTLTELACFCIPI